MNTRLFSKPSIRFWLIYILIILAAAGLLGIAIILKIASITLAGGTIAWVVMYYVDGDPQLKPQDLIRLYLLALWIPVLILYAVMPLICSHYGKA